MNIIEKIKNLFKKSEPETPQQLEETHKMSPELAEKAKSNGKWKGDPVIE